MSEPICDHENFIAKVDVNRLVDTEGGPVTHYCAEVAITCALCSERFVFYGLPSGSSPYQPTVSMDGYELRVPLGPKEARMPKGLPGFMVRRRV